MAGGDETAYRIFYDAYFNRLLRYLLVVTGGNEEASREALQLALVRVVRHIKPFAAEEKFWSWLTVLARSALADEGRKRRRYFAFLERFTRQQESAPAALNDGEADEQLRALLDRKLTALPEDERQRLLGLANSFFAAKLAAPPSLRSTIPTTQTTSQPNSTMRSTACRASASG